MKIRSVEIKNIASIVEAKVSFEEQPLKGADLFLITGPTGSGKTTLLDAITLALYATTPRVSKGSGNTQKVNSDEIIGKDPRNLMRMNTGEAYSKVYFTGNDGKEYCAVWSVARGKYKKPGSKMANYVWSVENLTDGVETRGDKSGGYKEVESIINNAVGLDFSQFCRTTMLAQGEFTQFLKSDAKGKADILEKISGSDIYSRIGAEIYRLSFEADKNYREEKSKYDSIVRLSDEERAAKEHEIVAKTAELAVVKKDSDAVQARIDWEKGYAKAVTDEVEAKLAADAAKLQVESDDFLAKEKLNRDWNATIDVRGQVALFEKEQAKVKDASEKLSAIGSGYRNAASGYMFEKQQLDLKFFEKASLEKELAAQQQNASAYGNAQTIVAKIEGIAVSSVQLDEKEKGLKVCVEQNLPEAQALLTKLQHEYKKAKEQEAEAKRAEDELDEKVKALGIEGLRSEKEFLMGLKLDIASVAQLEDEVASAKDAYAAEQVKIAPAEEKLAKDKEELERLEKEHERRMQSVTEAVKNMRMRLAQAMGDEENTCPVCGQLVSSLQDDSILDAEAAKVQKEFDAQKQKYKDAESALAKLTASVRVLCANVDKTAAQLDKAQKDLAAKLGSRDDRDQLLGMSQVQLQVAVDLLAGKIENGVQLEKELKKLSGIYRNCVEVSSAINTDVVKAEEGEKSVKDEIERLKREKEVLVVSIADAQKDVGALLEGSCGWVEDWKENADGFVKEIKDKAREFDAKRQSVTEIDTAIGRMEPVIKHVAQAQDRVLESMPQWKDMVVVPEQVENLEGVWQMLEREVNSLLSAISNSVEEAEKNRAAVEAFLNGNAGFDWECLKKLDDISTEEAGRMVEEISGKKQAYVIAVQRYNDSKAALEKILGERLEGEQMSVEVLEALKNGLKERNDELVAALALLAKELAEDDEKIKQKQDTTVLDALKAEAEKWGAFNKLYGDKEGTTLKQIAQTFILESLLNAANQHLRNMAPRYRLLVVPNSLELKLEDRYNGFSTRSTNTISGGESFLVSLSLALALADFGQHLGVSTLFIDEGFGTLSGEPLQNAINTLRMLHSEAGRQVGIISHREELRESIPVQIKVNLPDGSSVAKVEI